MIFDKEGDKCRLIEKGEAVIANDNPYPTRPCIFWVGDYQLGQPYYVGAPRQHEDGVVIMVSHITTGAIFSFFAPNTGDAYEKVAKWACEKIGIPF